MKRLTVALLLAVAFQLPCRGAELEVYPKEIGLHDVEALQRVVVQHRDDVIRGQVSEGLQLEIENPKIAKVDQLDQKTSPIF